MQVLVGGEAFDLNSGLHIATHKPNITLINCYGPTENTTFSTTFTFPKDYDFAQAPIGKRLQSDEVYVLNRNQELVEFGEVGELYVGGDGLALGYLNRRELTAKSFVNNPFASGGNTEKSERLYRTGDLVRYLPEGNLEFIGRADDQVKVRGFRIELGEIESQLSKLEQVSSVFVTTQPVAKIQQIVAYVKPIGLALESAELQKLGEQLKLKLAEELPEYMIPKFIVFIDKWPTNANGKVDKAELPAPQTALLQQSYLAPATEVECKLAEIWSQVLELELTAISADISFFELGGNSLLALRLNSSIQEAFDIELSAKELFANSTIKNIASLIERSQVQQYLSNMQKDSVVFDEGTL